MGYIDKQKQREYQRQWRASRRESFIASLGGKCALCSSIDNLEIDHMDRSKKSMNPTFIWSRSEAVRKSELSKCQILCKSCHLEKTSAEMKRAAQHGEMLMYRRGCRCNDCKAANAQRRRKQRSI